MKQLVLLVFITCCGASLHAQIPNPSFESWKNASEVLPENWEIIGTGAKTTSQSGNALKLSNNSSTGSLSYAALMNIDTSLFYKPAFAYNANPDSVTVVFKPLLGQDTSYFQIGFTSAGKLIPVVVAEFFLTGNSGQWTTRTFPFVYIQPQTGLTADSGYIVISSADEVFGPLSSGSIEIDAITFKFTNNSAAPNIPNHSFENWHSYIVEHPEAWGTTALFLQKQGIHTNNSSKSSDAQQGNTGIELRGITVDNIASGLTDTFPGQAITLRDPANPDPSNVDIFSPTFAVSARYTSFRGYIKSDLNPGDVAIAWVHFFEADSIVGTAIYSDQNDHSSYIEFSEDIVWDSMFTGIPDSATIMLLLTDTTVTGLTHLNSRVTFDNLRFDNWNTGLGKPLNRLQAGVYPNPSQGITMLKAQLTVAQPYTISVMAQDGRIVWSRSGVAQTDKNYFPLDLTNLSKGIYTLQVQSNNKQYSEKLILTP